ncbi:nucleocapsid protein [Wufeng Chodsigoa smithii henipavirus 1]|nr:nucleocapsid protein [Wufeng Chodsigoa smithii henipavirus 1]
MFSTLRHETESFREYQANLGRSGRPSAATATLTTKIIVFNPIGRDTTLRWEVVKFCMRLIQSERSSQAVKIGATISLLTLYAENPGAMVRSLMNDPDIEVVIVDIGSFEGEIPRLERRGAIAEQQMRSFTAIINSVAPRDLFERNDVDAMNMRDSGRYLTAISSILAQVWILVAKSVTAPDTAEESEGKRWAKYVQQKRVDPTYTVSKQWIKSVRDIISQNLSVRKYMVENLIEVKKSGSSKGRLNEMIADIGNYIEETGMAGFFLTIKYGLEMRYSVLASNELQADLLTIQTLMRTYKEIGVRAPYMVLLEDSIQTKFAPGNYPLLWSFAMGVGVTLDRSMGALNINRSYLEPMYFKLGQSMARQQAGSVDRKIAAELELSDQQLEDLKEVMKSVSSQRTETTLQAREGRFNVAGGALEDIDGTDDEDEGSYRPIRGNEFIDYTDPNIRRAMEMIGRNVDKNRRPLNTNKERDAAKEALMRDLMARGNKAKGTQLQNQNLMTREDQYQQDYDYQSNYTPLGSQELPRSNRSEGLTSNHMQDGLDNELNFLQSQN